MADIGIEQLLEAGVHFGHQTRRWNPKMRRFIHGERDGIYIIDLLKTARLLTEAQHFAGEVARRGGVVLFVGTKKQATDAVKEVADASGMPYVNHRWLGGLLTNFQTMSQRMRRLHDLERYASEGQLELLPTRERMAAQADLEKLQANLGGVKNMQRVPDAVFVVDLKTEAIAVKEAQRLRIPIIGLVDTNCDPDGVDYVIPGNDDAIRSCALISKAIGDVVSESHAIFRAEEEKARVEAEEKERREAEARAQREAEERAKREAEEESAREQAERAAAEAAFAAHKAAQAAAAQPQQTAAGPAAPQRASVERAQPEQAAAPASGQPQQPEPSQSQPQQPQPPQSQRQAPAAGEQPQPQQPQPQQPQPPQSQRPAPAAGEQPQGEGGQRHGEGGQAPAAGEQPQGEGGEQPRGEGGQQLSAQAPTSVGDAKDDR
ncbi:MAG: 30S ribosomal protein S2 [Solirubrobacteraceae bacterium]